MNRGDAMERLGTAITRVRGGVGGVLLRPRWSRVVGVLLVMLVTPLLIGLLGSTTALANDNASEDEDNYSLYQLASNGAGYFSNSNEPGESLGGAWGDIAESEPGAAGSLLGYGDPTVSQFKRWLSAGLSGSTQTITHETLGKGGDAFLAYGQFGAVNKDLGFDSMSSGVIGDIIGGFAGSVVWFCYGVSLLISGLFFAFIELLKFLNPFAWFYTAVADVTTAEGTSGGYQQGLADGMLNNCEGGDCGPPGALSGVANFIGEWYGLLVDLSWNFLVPLFLGFLLIGLVLFKKMDRGSAIKKFVVRLLFLGFGLPVFGSMYTAVLDGFSESGVDASAGATQVVLSNYVDFDAWAMNSRLLVPEDATIGWNADKGQADPKSTMSARTSALAINIASHPVYRDAGWDAGGVSSNAKDAWTGASNVDLTQEEPGSWLQVATTLDILNRYISGQETPASNFESGVKSWLSENADEDIKEDWFTNTASYGDVEKFGDEDDPQASEAPMISTQGEGLQSEVSDGVRTFTTKNQEDSAKDCGFMVTTDNGDPAQCSMSPLSMYNYLNSSFSSESLTSFSSENAMSGLVRENHSSVSQVGSGPASFMYWANTVTLLGSVCLLGIWYAFGMVIGALKRTFSLIAAIPFATLGAIAAISKVIIYSVAMILEVILTIFLYQLVARLIMGVPAIASGPLTNLVTENGLLSNLGLGPVAVVLLTFLSTLLIIAVTFILLRVRKTVLQALDEAVTKLVDKFLETDTAPKARQGGAMQAAAGGLGAGAGMAAGNKLAQATGGKLGGLTKPNGSGQPGPGGGGKNKPNVGGIPSNAQLKGGNTKALGSGQSGPGEQGPGGRKSPQGGPGTFNGPKSSPKESSNEQGSAGQPGQSRRGGPLQLAGAPPGSAQEDRAAADGVDRQGGLSRLGFDAKDQQKVEIPGGGVTTGDVAGSDPGQQVPGGQGRGAQGEVVPNRPGGRGPKGVEPGAGQTNFSGSNPGDQQTRSTPRSGSRSDGTSVPTRFDVQAGPGGQAGTPGLKPVPQSPRSPGGAIPLPAGPTPAASTVPAAATPKAPSNAGPTVIGGPSTGGGAPRGNGFSHRYSSPSGSGAQGSPKTRDSKVEAGPGQRTSSQPGARKIAERPKPVKRPDGS
ncbi:hypothetical protein GCM10009642_64070 [Nocardiopsis metallicus]